ncbi:MAG: hypothetical protein EBV06_08125 [Planctomycetia bacterium]|nr:hypothetical protein [Planctomycetia bacterium]
MTDKSSQLLLVGLTRALADPSGTALIAGRAAPGLFPCTTAGKQAAQRCRDEGYLTEDGRITDRGMYYLFNEVNPREILKDFVRVIESREKQIHELGAKVCTLLAGVEAMRGHLCHTLAHLEKQADLKALCRDFYQRSDEEIAPTLLCCIAARKAPDDMSLPELYAQACKFKPGLTIGTFHDALRYLDARGQIRLHPWTGPLYEVPQPRFGLLIGHQISYYVSGCGSGPDSDASQQV